MVACPEAHGQPDIAFAAYLAILRISIAVGVDVVGEPDVAINIDVLFCRRTALAACRAPWNHRTGIVIDVFVDPH